jgi:hypothetical protein
MEATGFQILKYYVLIVILIKVAMFRRAMHSVLTGTCLALLMNCNSGIKNFQEDAFKPYIAEFSRFGNMADKSIPPRVLNVGVIFGKVEAQNYAQYNM